jgi:hypothetical protein
MEVSGQPHAPVTLPPGKEPLDRRLFWPQSRTGCGGEEKKFSNPRRVYQRFGGPYCLYLQGEVSGAWIEIRVEFFWVVTPYCVVVGYKHSI